LFIGLAFLLRGLISLRLIVRLFFRFPFSSAILKIGLGFVWELRPFHSEFLSDCAPPLLVAGSSMLLRLTRPGLRPILHRAVLDQVQFQLLGCAVGDLDMFKFLTSPKASLKAIDIDWNVETDA
jgi:hypothetical protein